MTKMWEKVTLREKHDADRVCIQLDQSHRDRVAGYVPYVEDDSDDSRVIPPCRY